MTDETLTLHMPIGVAPMTDAQAHTAGRVEAWFTNLIKVAKEVGDKEQVAIFGLLRASQSAREIDATIAAQQAELAFEKAAHREMSAVAAERTAELLKAEAKLTTLREQIKGWRHYVWRTHSDSPSCDGCAQARSALEGAEGVTS